MTISSSRALLLPAAVAVLVAAQTSVIGECLMAPFVVVCGGVMAFLPQNIHLHVHSSYMYSQ